MYTYQVTSRKGESIVAWCLKYSIASHKSPPCTHKQSDCVYVCMLKGQFGPRVFVAHSPAALHIIRERCASSTNSMWFLVPIDHVRPFLKGDVVHS